MLRAIAIATILFTTAVALGGAGDTPLDLTENAAAECGRVALGDDPCPPSPGCIVAGIVQRATGQEMHCTQ